MARRAAGAVPAAVPGVVSGAALGGIPGGMPGVDGGSLGVAAADARSAAAYQQEMTQVAMAASTGDAAAVAPAAPATPAPVAIPLPPPRPEIAVRETANGEPGGVAMSVWERSPSVEAASAAQLFAGPGETRARCRDLDWASTPLGAVDRWPAALRTLAPVVLASGLPALLFWGPDVVMLYNDAYAPLIGVKHPGALGRPLFDAFPEVRETFAPLVARAFGGETITLVDVPIPFERGGAGQPSATGTYTLSYAPVRDDAVGAGDAPAVLGLHVVVTETTAQVALRAAEAERRRAEESRQESEARAQALVANLPGGAVFVVDHDLRYRVAEGEALRASGVAPADLVGRTVHEAMPPDVATGYERHYRAALGGEPFLHEHEAHGRVYASRGTPLRDASGAVYAALAVSYDITDRRRAEDTARAAEARQAFLLALSDALRPLQDPGTIQGEACRRLGDRLGVDRAYYVEVDEAAGVARVDRDWVRAGGGPSLVGEHRVADFAWSVAILRRGESYAVADTQASPLVPPAERPAAAALQLIACVGAPLVKGGRLVGALCVTAARTRAWTADEVALVQEVGERTWEASERARTEAALRDAEARYRAVANLVPHLLWESAPNGQTSWYNDRWYAYTGQTPAEAAGWGWTNAIHPEDRAASETRYREAVAAGRALRREHRIRAADGSYRWFLVQADPAKDGAGGVVRWLGAATDVHEQRLALEDVERRVAARTAELALSNARLRDENEARARAQVERNAMLRRLATAQEAERRHLARELHDEAGQHLTAIGLGLTALTDAVPPGSEADRRVDALRGLVDTLGRELHALAVQLRPRALDDFGLETALDVYGDAWSRQSGIPLDVHARVDAERLTPAVESAVYRIVQEALTNVARHSGASRAGVVVERSDGHVRVTVEDDGRGFDAAPRDAAAGLGLLGVHERATLLGGSVEVESAPGAGTTLYVRIPVDGAAPAAPAGA